MSKALRTTFAVHCIVSLVVGALLLGMPGRVLTALRWAPIDPVISRLLGAALLALAWGSFRGWRATERSQAAFVLEVAAAFTVLGCAGLLRHVLVGSWPWFVWTLLAVLLAFAAAWVVLLVRGKAAS